MENNQNIGFEDLFDNDNLDDDSNNDNEQEYQEQAPQGEIDWEKRALELENSNRQLMHQRDSEKGRAVAFQNKYHDANKIIEDGNLGSSSNFGGVDLAELSQDELAEVMNEAPELASLVNQMVESKIGMSNREMREQMDLMRSEFAPLQQQQQTNETDMQLDRLYEVHPDFQDFGKDNTEFWNWANSNQHWAQMADSQNASDVSDALSFYKQVVQGGRQQPRNEANSLDSYVTPRRNNGGNQRVVNDDDLDPIALFAQITK